MSPDYQTLPSRRVSAPRIIVLSVLLIGLVVLVWLVFFHQTPVTSPQSTAKPPSIAQKQPSKPKPSQSSSPAGVASPTPPRGSSTTGSGPQQTAQPKPSPQSLTNTGPGNTIAIFVLATMVGIGAGNIYLRRRLAGKSDK